MVVQETLDLLVKVRFLHPLPILFGVYCQLGDGLIWSQEAAGASPVTPTILK